MKASPRLGESPWAGCPNAEEKESRETAIPPMILVLYKLKFPMAMNLGNLLGKEQINF